MNTKHLIIISSLWILVIALSLAWNHYIVESHTLKLVGNKAKAFFDEIVITRNWNSLHGGVYVPIDSLTQPNSYLNDPLRDIETINGMKLTKVNPSFMTRQIAEINKSKNDLQFHITSLKPIRPENKPDDWERKALLAFENKEQEFLELVENDSSSLYRYMAPLITEESCLKCHAIQGYKVGDIRGGISISFPSSIYSASNRSQIFYLSLAHLMILVLGIVGIYKYFKMSGNYFAALKAKNEELSGFIAEKDKFFSIIAHDLRSPITSFMGLTGLMAEDAKTLPPERLEKMARLLNNSATSLYGLLDNLLDWASMQRGMFSYNPVTFNLATQVMECLQLTRDSAHSKNIEMEITIPDYLEVFADKRMFETVLRNLVLNAVKFTQKGGNVDVSARKREGDLIEIRVRDTGIGMKKELVDQLFKISGQTGRPGTDGEPSTGLGLIICKDFVEQHNGQIWVESEEGKGSTFIFTIPKDSAV